MKGTGHLVILKEEDDDADEADAEGDGGDDVN